MTQHDPIDSNRRTARPWLTLALMIATGSTSGCGDLAEEVETVQSAVSAYWTYAYADTTRVMKRGCGQKCAQYTLPTGGNLHSIQCLRWVTDCSVPGPYESLHADYAAANANAIFPAYNQGPSWQYDGCGPQAAQNVLNYYGVQMPILDVAQYIHTFSLVAGSNDHSIATFPDDLASGLQRLLNEKVAPKHFTVARRSNVNPGIEVDNALRSGNPIILLVNGGDHYQVATGTGTGGVFVIDYPGNDQWRDWTSLGMDLPWYSDIFSTVSFGAGGYEDYTVITIDYKRPCGMLTRGESLGPGQSVSSCDGRFRLTMQTDGNLVLYQQSTALWNSGTQGTTGQRAIMQNDGNFVVYDAGNNAVWHSHTYNNPGAYLAVQNDGNLVVYNGGGSYLWASWTCCH
jgi:hypothetical protein